MSSYNKRRGKETGCKRDTVGIRETEVAARAQGYHNKESGRSRVECHQPSHRSMSPRSMQVYLRRRITQRRRKSLESVNPEACSVTREFFGARKVDVLHEVSDMEKPTHDRRIDDAISLRELAGVLSTLHMGAVERGLFHHVVEETDNN